MKNSVVAVAAAALLSSALIGFPVPEPVAAEPVEDRVPQLLADINQNVVGLEPNGLAAGPTAAYFGRTLFIEGERQAQLWRHDRSNGATDVVFAATNVEFIRPLAVIGDKVVFTAATEAEGVEPWVYDHVSGEVELLRDIAPGESGSRIRDMVIGARVYFTAFGDAGQELWATEGSPESTELIADINPGPASSDVRDLKVVPTGPGTSTLLFTASSPDTGQELFRFDEGVGITPIEVNAGSAGSSPSSYAIADDGVVYFTAQESGEPSAAYEIVGFGVVPGSDVPEKVALGSQTTSLAVVGSTMFARSRNSFGASLWTVDGSGATPEVIDASFFGQDLVDAGNGLLFQQGTGTATELGISDGTDVGTVVDATVTVGYNSPVGLSGSPGVLFGAEAYDRETGTEPWVSMGEAGSTAEVLDVRPGPFGSNPRSMTDGGDRWFFFADDGTTGTQLWSTDGSSEETTRLTGIGLDEGASSGPRNFESVGEATYFTARKPDGFNSLWAHRRDTNTVEEVVTSDGRTIAASSSTIPFGDSLVFSGDDGESGFEPWITDGTAAGTNRLADTEPGPDNGTPNTFLAVDDSIVFVAASATWVLRRGSLTATLLNDEEWRAGASIGRRFLSEACAPDCAVYAIDIDTGDAAPLLDDARLGSSASFDGAVYFADSLDAGLFRSDGTAAGTQAVPGTAAISVDELTAASERLVFTGPPAAGDPTLNEFAMYSLSLAGVVNPIGLPAGVDLEFVDLGGQSLALEDGRLLSVAQRVSEGEKRIAEPEDGELLVVVDGPAMTVVAEFASQSVEWLGSYQNQPLVLTAASIDEDKKPSKAEIGVTLWSTDGTPGGTAPYVDFGAAGLVSYFWATLGGDLLYGGGTTLAAGNEPFAFDLAPDVIPPTPALVSLSPERLLDSRSNGETVDDLFEKIGKIEAGEFVELDVLGRGGVPNFDVSSVVLNVTMIRPDGNGFVTTYTCGDRPNASSMNAPNGGGVVANEVIAKLSISGTVCLYTSVGTDLAADVTGYVPSSSQVQSLDPGRLLDTRVNGETVDDLFEKVGKVDAGEFVELDVLGRGGVPTAGVGSVVLNVTMIRPDGNGFATIYPCGTRPNASSINAPNGGGVVANEVIAKVSAAGTVCLYSSVATDLAADVTGFVPNAAGMTSVDPARLLDTRATGETVDDLFENVGKVEAGEFVELDVLDRGGVPAAGVGSVVLNVTMIRPDGNGFMTIYPCNLRPNASSMNAPSGGGVVANEVIAKVSDTGTVCLYTSVGTDIAADVTGYVEA